MSHSRRVVNAMASDKITIPAISEDDVLEVLTL